MGQCHPSFYSVCRTKAHTGPLIFLCTTHLRYRGAWRTGSRKDHISLARHLASSGQIAVAVIGYRLTVLKSQDGPDEPFHKPIYENQHPAHVDDLFAALQFLVLTQPREGEPCSYYDRNRLILVGHSVGAWMASALLLESGHYHSNIPALATSPCAARLLRRSIVGWILIVCTLRLLQPYEDAHRFVRPRHDPRTAYMTSKACSENILIIARSSHKQFLVFLLNKVMMIVLPCKQLRY